MTSSRYDAVIVGSGFGGATVAVSLARAGRRVLVIERGRWVDRDDSAWDPVAIQIEQKYRSESPEDQDGRDGRTMYHPDAAVGGKSVFYGAASLRLRREDFRASDRFADLPNAASMDWPFHYDDLAPFYDQAEREIGVAGIAGTDPCEPPRRADYPTRPPAFGTTARKIARAAERLGLKPFPIPLAINFGNTDGRTSCVRCMTCDLFPCKIEAKNDLAVTVLAEARALGVEIRDRTVAVRLLRNAHRIDGVECLHVETGERTTVRGDLYVVSAGAIPSPALLLRSGLGDVEPNGREIGRYLMRHCSGIMIGVFPFRTNPERLFHKQVAVTDFYFGRDGAFPAGPWGSIQSLQTPPPAFVRHEAPYPAPIGQIAAKSLAFQAYLLCIAEDLPQRDNRVEIDASRTDPLGLPITRVTHRYTSRDLAARDALYTQAGRILRRAGALFRLRFPIHTYSHALGSCRIGTDPTNSVLDPWCGFHGIPNLFVVDGSFMPSSAGVNPSLTIAANGFRVGAHVVEHWDDRVRGRVV
jgi:choline dehydrogenase-like flavoprotein